MVDLGKKDVRAWTRLVRAQRMLTDLVDLRLKAATLPPVAWYPTLHELDRASDAGLRLFEIEQATGEAQYSVSRMVDRIEKAGLVRRAPCEDDRRGWRILITPEGRAARAAMWDVYARVLEENFVDRLSGKQIRALDEILGDLLPKAQGKRD
jgi:DNA-binding MarR family transcriptional regulator